jgi:glycosyltransferase involved in cell wall biosynthesis
LGGAALFGQERGNIAALAALQEQGCEVLCLVRNDTWAVRLPEALNEQGLAWVKVPYLEHRMPGRMKHFLFRNPLAFLQANWQFRRIARDFRPTHIHSCNPLYVVNFLISLSALRIPFVYRAGDEPTVHNWFWVLIWRLVVWRTDQFVANSVFVAKGLVRHGVTEERITVIYNAPPSRPDRREDALLIPTGDRSQRVIYVGQIAEHKGVHILIEAFRCLAAEFPDAQVLIVGRVSDWSGDAWARRLRDATLADPIIGSSVLFTGEREDVPALLRASSIHVAPSLFDDPAPNVVMEAKRAGCPTVAFSRGGLPELVNDGVDGFLCADATSVSLADAVRRYLAEPELAARHGHAARASLDRLGIPRFAESWLTVYSNTTTQGRVPSRLRKSAGKTGEILGIEWKPGDAD